MHRARAAGPRARRLNSAIAKTGLWFPVDVSTKARATLGGMAGNNSCGTRSIRYGVMRDNVTAIDAILTDGSEARFGELVGRPDGRNAPDAAAALMRNLVASDIVKPRISRRPIRKPRGASAATISTPWFPARRPSISRRFWSAPRAHWRCPSALR